MLPDRSSKLQVKKSLKLPSFRGGVLDHGLAVAGKNNSPILSENLSRLNTQKIRLITITPTLKHILKMPSVLASEDHLMPNAAAESGENVASNPDETFIDLNDQRIRVVRNELSLSPNGNG